MLLSEKLTISEAGQVRESVLVRCPNCTPTPPRESLLRGVDRVVTWDDWRPSPALAEAEKAIRALLAGERSRVFLRGRYGIGKTMLAQIAAWEWTARGEPALVVNVPDFLASLKETFDENSKGERFSTSEATYAGRFETYAQVPLLVLDDLGAEYRTHWAAAELFRIIDHRYQRKAPLIVTSNEQFSDALDGRVLSRLAPGEVIIRGVADQRKVYER